MVLTLLVWGLFAPDRGLYQDDGSQMAHAKEAWTSAGLPGLLAPMGSPTRRLLAVPFFIAWVTPEPVFALQLLYGLSWLAVAWAAWRLAVELFPGGPRAAWMAGTLTVCATGDYLTGSPVALGYQVCTFLALVGLWCALRFVRGCPWPWLVAGCASAAASVFTVDGASVVLALAPLLFLAVGGLGRRVAAAAAAWVAVLAPYGLLFIGALHDPATYVGSSTFPLTVVDRIRRTWILTSNDLFPWTWTFSRVPFGDPPPRAIPVWLWAAAASLGLFLVARGLARLPDDPPAPAPRRELLVAAWCVFATVALHAAWASVVFSQYFYRTQVLSRVLVSTVIGLAASRLLARNGAPRIAGLALVALFTGFGVAGGMERQDMYLATWRRHRVELSSLVEEVPRAKPAATLLLVVPHDPAYQATEVPYLARRWSEFLWEDGATRPQTFLWSVDAMTSCVASLEGFRCYMPEEKECFDSGACPGKRLSWGEIILLTWRVEEGRFRLEDEIPAVLLGDLPPPLYRYRPRDLILPGPPDPRAARYLHGDVGLAKLLP
ncbi:MAG TPA: hypothetical protein VGM13_11040 [Thermoanaerobaculia bacterium]